ncbi:hypothetical protein B0A49_05406 [Cryomyces minteri]|uniref:FAS1 domain-containing protein n=1 Tax=Cryomyces minteri TaxID=331657 RepID=A0A4V5NDF2_9PEZI|nr:hypothetical protein B0A49_10402 [Cryomyces minteri]TKA63129.1 hypothetical protein B0A49_09484 [Cryomyces minteri]TKA67771.1 hypothetical protein B0A49_05406 [Cryomyces minteri]
MMNTPNIALPPPNGDRSPQESSSFGDVIISDVLGKDRSINIFAGLTRDIETISSRFDSSSQNSTILAPLNAEITKLPRKPWEDPREYKEFGENAYDGQAGEDRAHRNLRRFVEAHVVPESPWKADEKVKTLGGGTLWFEQVGGKRFIQPGNVEVLSIADKVANGEVWIIKGVLNYA